jgi:hypothetical protein
MPDDSAPDPASIEVDTPSDPNVPADSPLAAGLKEDVPAIQAEKQEDEYNRHQQWLVKKTHDEHERYRKEMQHYVDYFQQQTSTLNEPAPQQQAMPQMPQEAKNKAAESVMSVLAIAAIAFTVFGRKSGNSFAQAALMNGVGSMLQGYAQGRHQKAEDDKIKWHELWQMKNQENRDRLNDYRETINNKRLNLQQQMDLIRMKAQLHNDAELEAKAEQGNLNEVVKNLEAKRKAHQKVINGLVGANAKDYRAGPLREWREFVRSKSHGELDPARGDDEREKAYELYPYDEFMKFKKETAKQIEEEKKKSSEKDPLDLGL